VTAGRRPRRRQAREAERLPLRGVRVLDLGTVWAGPQAATLLGDLGADVAKVEGPTRPDPLRTMFGAADPGQYLGDEILEWSPLYCGLNRNKRGVALDLRTAQGNEACRTLALAADAVIDNFSVGVLERLELGYPALRTANRRLVTCSMPGFGRTGPLRDVVTYGPIVEQMSGALALSGYEDTGPVGLASAFDGIAGCYGALAVAAALFGRMRSGHAADLDVAQMEVGAAVTGAYIVDRQLGQPPFVRDGNADPWHAPHRCYRCAGDDRWVAIAVRDDASFACLAKACGHPEWTVDQRFRTASLRKKNESALDELVQGWTVERTADEAADMLQRAGATAAPLRSVREAVREPRLRDAGAFVLVDRIPNGLREYCAPIPRVDGHRLPVRLPAPRIGEHTDEVLGDWVVPHHEPLPDGPLDAPWLEEISPGDRPLVGVRVLLHARSEAASIAAWQLASLGAQVWRDDLTIEKDADRTQGALTVHCTGMRIGVPDRAHVILADADLLEDGLHPPIDAPVLVTVRTRVQGWRLDDLTCCALSSLSWRVGEPGREPLEPGRGYPSAVCGTLASFSAVSLLIDELRSAHDRPRPRSRNADVSLLESTLLMSAYDTVVLSFGGDPPPRSRRPWPTLTFPCRDGWVGIFPRTEDMWEALCAMVDRVDLLNDTRMKTFAHRQENSDALYVELAPWFAARTRGEADAAARSLRVPLAVVYDPLDLIRHEQFVARDLFLEVSARDGRAVLAPGLPYLSDGVRFGTC